MKFLLATGLLIGLCLGGCSSDGSGANSPSVTAEGFDQELNQAIDKMIRQRVDTFGSELNDEEFQRKERKYLKELAQDIRPELVQIHKDNLSRSKDDRQRLMWERMMEHNEEFSRSRKSASSNAE